MRPSEAGQLTEPYPLDLQFPPLGFLYNLLITGLIARQTNFQPSPVTACLPHPWKFIALRLHQHPSGKQSVNQAFHLINVLANSLNQYCIETLAMSGSTQVIWLIAQHNHSTRQLILSAIILSFDGDTFAHTQAQGEVCLLTN
ncbi:hypothetical protein A1OU_15985 [Enterovibrio norvegicus]|nr:hypothetical protein A1OU_15985 [Enterovibrio norvegicus]